MDAKGIVTRMGEDPLAGLRGEAIEPGPAKPDSPSFDLDLACAAAMRRVRASITRSVNRHLASMGLRSQVERKTRKAAQ